MFLCFPGLAQWGGNQAVDWLYCQLGYLLFAHCKERLSETSVLTGVNQTLRGPVINQRVKAVRFFLLLAV